jgi:hypothetical protein
MQQNKKCLLNWFFINLFFFSNNTEVSSRIVCKELRFVWSFWHFLLSREIFQDPKLQTKKKLIFQVIVFSDKFTLKKLKKNLLVIIRRWQHWRHWRPRRHWQHDVIDEIDVIDETDAINKIDDIDNMTSLTKLTPFAKLTSLIL